MEIKGINEQNGTIKLSDGIEEFDISFSKFHEINKELRLKDIGNYTSEKDIS